MRRAWRWRCALALLLAGVSSGAWAQTVVKYLHTDALGSVVAVTDASGAVIERREYTPYGGQTAPALRDGPGYTGHVQDAATGLTYMQQRYYDSEIGRFLSVDPVVALSDPIAMFNRYKYGANNPYKYVDPDGMCERTTGSRICGGGGSGNVSSIQINSPSQRDAAAAGAAVTIGVGGSPIPTGSAGAGSRVAAGLLSASVSAAALGLTAAVYSTAVGVGSDDTSRISLYHGTSVSHGLNFLNGMLLSQSAVLANRVHGAPGFYLATDPVTATGFGEYHADSSGYTVLQFSISRQAMSALTQNGARFQTIPQGGWFQRPPGAELYVPFSAFGTFNSMLGTGNIIVTPYIGN